MAQIERLPVESLSLDPANARKHSDRNIEAVVGSLRRFGQQKPIVVDVSNVVRAGNGTLEAARRLGWTHIDCVRSELQGADMAAYAVADNRTAELAEWDPQMLTATLQGFDDDLLLSAGFNEAELTDLLRDLEPPAEVMEDEVPEPPAEPVTKPGDLWILGEVVTCPKCKRQTDV